MPTFDVPAVARRDEATPVRVTDLAAGARVTLTARTDGWRGGEKTSRATFEADASGVVDTATHAPVAGDYEGVSPMGWLWALTATGADADADADADAGAFDPDAPVGITLEACVDGDVVATATTRRRRTTAAVTSTAVAAGDVRGTLYADASATAAPGVLLLHGSDGRPLHALAQLLASRGYAALALRYFGGDDQPDALREIPIETVDAAARWLHRRDEVDDGPGGLLGVSKGAEAALVAAARFDWPGAVVAVAPTRYRWQALDRDAAEPTGSWTHDGEVLPFLPFRAAPGEDDAGNVVFRAVYAGTLDRVSEDARAAARIPVEDVAGPALFVAGEADQMWPAARSARELAAGAPNAQCLTYADAGHGLTAPHVPTAPTTGGRGVALGGTPAGNARANADWWPAALDVLADGLGSPTRDGER